MQKSFDIEQYAHLTQLFMEQTEQEFASKKKEMTAMRYADAQNKYINAAYRILPFTDFHTLVEEVYGTSTPPQEFLIPMYQEAGELEDILGIYNALITQNPDNLQYHISKAATLSALQRKEAAVAVLEEVKAKRPEAAAEIDAYIQSLNTQ